MKNPPDKNEEQAKDQLSDEELDPVSGGFNPQPDPPGVTRSTTTTTTTNPVQSPGVSSGILIANHNQTLKRVRRHA